MILLVKKQMEKTIQNPCLIDHLTAEFSLCWRKYITDLNHGVFLTKLHRINEVKISNQGLHKC